MSRSHFSPAPRSDGHVRRNHTIRSWSLAVDDQVVSQIVIDWAVNLCLASDSAPYDIRIESPFVVTSNGRDTLVVPEEPHTIAPVLSTLRQHVSAIEAYDDGHLELRTVNGTLVSVPATEDFEPWSATGPSGLRIVSVPGGHLAVWMPDEDQLG